MKEEDRQRRKKIIDDYIESYNTELQKQRDKVYKELKEDADKKNGICPRCGSSEVYTLVKKKGFSVNKCKSCDSEWEIVEPEYPYWLTYIFGYDGTRNFVYLVKEYLKASRKEEFKKEHSYSLKEYMNLPPEVLDYIYCLGLGGNEDPYSYIARDEVHELFESPF